MTDPADAFKSMNEKSNFLEKISAFKQQLSPLDDGEIETFESQPEGYRMRVEFRVWHENEKSHYAMHRPGTKELYFIESFSPANASINSLMPVLMGQIERSEHLRKKLFSLEFLSTKSGEVLVTLIYHKPLDEEWEMLARSLQEELAIGVIGRSRKQKVVLHQDFVTETLCVLGTEYRYRQYENSFTQPNALMNEKMLSWACERAKNSNGDLLELYCGNGNFTLPLSKFFDKVLATEISKASIAALKWNLSANHIENIAYARLSAEEITQALDRVRPFRRLAHINLDDYNFETVFVDPPRAGVDKQTLKLLSRFENIIYISCNPTTLIENLEDLKDTHQVIAAAAFDQFPLTPHLETGVCLRKLA